jgi:hypothetical protein
MIIGGRRWPKWSVLPRAVDDLDFPAQQWPDDSAGPVVCGTRGWILPDDPDLPAPTRKSICVKLAGCACRWKLRRCASRDMN